jgi:hypothetical protein
MLLGILALALACGGCKKKEETLSLLVWEGYSEDSAVSAFEESHHCKVKASYMGSSDELVAKLRGGSASNYDFISPSQRRRLFHRAHRTCCSSRSFETSFLSAALRQTAGFAARQSQRPDLWRPVYVGPESASL